MLVTKQTDLLTSLSAIKVLSSFIRRIWSWFVSSSRLISSRFFSLLSVSSTSCPCRLSSSRFFSLLSVGDDVSFWEEVQRVTIVCWWEIQIWSLLQLLLKRCWIINALLRLQRICWYTTLLLKLLIIKGTIKTLYYLCICWLFNLLIIVSMMWCRFKSCISFIVLPKDERKSFGVPSSFVGMSFFKRKNRT